MTREIWVTSDTHFGHANIIKYCDRPFANADEMDEFIIDKWNSVVKDGDIVYHLGDVYFGNSGKNAIYRLNGRKRLILGNHDNGKDKNLQTVFQKISVWRMFTEFGLLLTHVPVHESALYRGMKGDKMLNVHGHIHTNPSPTSDHKCVCVEHTNYTPVNIEELRIL